MLSKIDKNRILDLRSQDYSYCAIHEKLGFAIDTIMKICQQEKKQKNQEKTYSQREISNSNDPIIMLRRIEIDIGNVIEAGKLNDRDRRKWEKRREDIRAILKSEVDDRISKVSADAIEKRDIQWGREIENNYVRKEIVAGFENTIKEKDDIIVKLRSKIEKSDGNLIEKENKISRLKYSKNCEIQDLKDQLDDVYDKNINLNNENWRLQEYIDNRFDLDVNIKQDKLNNEIDAFNSEKKDFFRFEDKQQLNLDNICLETQTKLETVEKREKKLEKQSEEIKQRKDEFDKKINQICDLYKERIKVVVKREESVTELEKKLLKQKEELNEERIKIQDDQECMTEKWKRIKIIAERQKNKDQRNQKTWNKNDSFKKVSTPQTIFRKAKLVGATDLKIIKQQKPVTLIPISISGGPVIKSGFSPIIRSGGEPMVIMSGLEPVVQPGFPSVTQSGGETKVVNSSGGTMTQSGYSPN
jgi:hypothetical protein